MGADSCPAVCRLAHAEAMCLRCVCIVLEVLLAWRSTSVAFLLVPLPPSAFVLIYLFSYLFFRGLVHLLPLGFWPQCDGCYSGGPGEGGSWLGCGLVDLWVFFRLGVYCGCSPLAHGHPTSTCDAGVKCSSHLPSGQGSR